MTDTCRNDNGCLYPATPNLEGTCAGARTCLAGVALDQVNAMMKAFADVEPTQVDVHDDGTADVWVTLPAAVEYITIRVARN